MKSKKDSKTIEIPLPKQSVEQVEALIQKELSDIHFSWVAIQLLQKELHGQQLTNRLAEKLAVYANPSTTSAKLTLILVNPKYNFLTKEQKREITLIRDLINLIRARRKVDWSWMKSFKSRSRMIEIQHFLRIQGHVDMI